MTGQNPPRRSLTYWRIHLLLLCFVPALIGGFFYYTAAKLFTVWTFVWVAIFLLLCFVYYPMYYRCYRYSVSNTLIKVNRGVIYRQMEAVYIRNLQYTTLIQTPLQRILNLATLRLYAAGGAIWIRCLNYEEARLLRVQLAKKMEVAHEQSNHH